MATKAKKSAKDIAESWARGNQEWQDAVAETNQQISEEARRMRDAGEEPGKIVAMAAQRFRDFSDQYHSHEG